MNETAMCFPFAHISLDTDECEVEMDNCHADSFCTNTDGSFNCTCLVGYSGDGVSCTGKLKTAYSQLSTKVCLTFICKKNDKNKRN